MNKQTQEALKMAVEALESNKRTHYYCEDNWYSCPKHEDGCANDFSGAECDCGADETNAEFEQAIQACKEALAQDEKFCDGNCVWTDHHPNCNLAKPIQNAIDFLDGSYEAHKVRKALQETIKPHPNCDEACMYQCEMEKKHGMTYEQGFAHGYEAHRVEQELEQPSQEPVYAIVVDKHIQYDIDTGLLEIYNSKEEAEKNTFKGATIKAIDVLTHHAPTKEWVGLSDDEIDKEALKDDHAAYFALGALWANQALKEKNS